MSGRRGIDNVCGMSCFGERNTNARAVGRKRKGLFGRTFSLRVNQKIKCLGDAAQKLRDSGLRKCGLIVGIDFTNANADGGKSSFAGRNLHNLDEPENPYVMNLTIIPRVLEGLDGECRMSGYGFGDTSTRERSVFSFFSEHATVTEQATLLHRYKEIVPLINASAPTSCAPLIRQAMRRVFHNSMDFHLLLILLAGPISMNCRAATVDAIFHASYFPMSIIMIGVGDGPWEEMQHFKEDLPPRRWENFSFVEFKDFRKISKLSQAAREKKEARFACKVLEDLPRQFESINESRGPVDQQSVQNIISRIPESILIGPPTDE